MSTVYKAFDETLQRPVAIKVLHREISSDPEQLERFRREARTVAQLSHPNVVTVIDAGEDDDGYPFIVFQYVDGETLKDRIRRAGPLPVAEAVAYAIEIGRGLEAAHSARLVHRDVKPQNVLIDRQGRAKVTDFGIARSLEGDATLTDSGSVLGTTDYVAPEQAMGEGVTEQSDLYSLGVCLYEMLTGEVPFKADSLVGVAMRHIREPLPDIRQRRPEVSANLAAVVERATSKRPHDRYQSAEQMVSELEHALSIELARTGDDSQGSTSPMRVLGSDRSQARQAATRGPARKVVATIAAVCCGLAVLAFAASQLGHQANHSKAGGGSASPPAAHGGAGGPVQLASNPVAAFDPVGGPDHPEVARNAVDGNPSTFWDTEHYTSRSFGNLKQGTGIYLQTANPVAARVLAVQTPTPGWTGQVFASNASAPPQSLSGWTPVSPISTADSEGQQIALQTGGRQYRYYLLWITTLPAGNHAEIAELGLGQ